MVGQALTIFILLLNIAYNASESKVRCKLRRYLFQDSKQIDSPAYCGKRDWGSVGVADTKSKCKCQNSCPQDLYKNVEMTSWVDGWRSRTGRTYNHKVTEMSLEVFHMKYIYNFSSANLLFPAYSVRCKRTPTVIVRHKWKRKSRST
jgi:hypothetical protein